MDNNYSYEDFLRIIEQLRSENGCPWDRKQTHESLRSCMVEEAHEFLSSVRILQESGSGENMCEELGDLLLQIVMHAQIAREEGLFTMDDVINGVSAKMIRRHPHVFGDTQVTEVSDVWTNWDEIKKAEKEGKEWIVSPLREIPPEHPALTRAAKVCKKIHKLYEPLPEYGDITADMQEVTRRLQEAGETISEEELCNIVGTLLTEISKLCALKRIPAEQILTDRIEEMIERYEKM